MNNTDVARAFDQIADLLEIQGADNFRVNSYRRVARTVDDLAEDINDVADRNELATLPGVGKSSAERIRELLDTGRVAIYDKLTAEIPPTLLDLLEIPTLGPKKVALLWREVGVTSVDDLQSAIAAGKLADLKGFGEKTIQKIRRGIEFRARSAGRVRLGVAARVGNQIRDAVAALPGVRRVELAGSLRRGRETVGDLDVLCIADDGSTVTQAFSELAEVTDVLGAGPTKASVEWQYRPGRTIQVDVRVVTEEAFGAAWQYFTGSKEHNVRLRERAAQRGWSLNEYGLTEDQRIIASAAEEEIYTALDLPWIPPELREDRGEFEADCIPDDLLTHDDIRGDLHMHTVASDGRCDIAELAAAAHDRGYDYICITDHSGSSAIANGLAPDRLVKHIADVRAAARDIDNIAVLMGTEVDILADGTLDYPDELLAELDFVIASIHSGMGQDVEANTRRTIAALENPYVNCVGHPTGRLIGEREAMALDIESVCRVAGQTGTALEINANTYRLDLKDQHARLARAHGAKLAINTDAHDTQQFDQMPFGVLTARRAWLRRDDVLNAGSIDDIRAFVTAKRTTLT